MVRPEPVFILDRIKTESTATAAACIKGALKRSCTEQIDHLEREIMAMPCEVVCPACYLVLTYEYSLTAYLDA